MLSCCGAAALLKLAPLRSEVSRDRYEREPEVFVADAVFGHMSLPLCSDVSGLLDGISHVLSKGTSYGLPFEFPPSSVLLNSYIPHS